MHSGLGNAIATLQQSWPRRDADKRVPGYRANDVQGWVNGRGDDSMIMLKGYAHMVHFFTSFEWWKANPHDELVNDGAFCLAGPGEYTSFICRMAAALA